MNFRTFATRVPCGRHGCHYRFRSLSADGRTRLSELERSPSRKRGELAAPCSLLPARCSQLS